MSTPNDQARIADGLARIAKLSNLSISDDDLEHWAPILAALFADLERMIDMPIEDREPAFVATRLVPGTAGEGA